MTNERKINTIVIHGLSNSGKSTAAELLQHEILERGTSKIESFAEPVKQIASILGMTDVNLFESQIEKRLSKVDSSLSPTKDDTCNLRQLLTTVGEGICEMYRDDIFAQIVKRKIRRNKEVGLITIVSDLRKMVEYDTISVNRDEQLYIKIVRDGIEPSEHITERGLPDNLFDFVIINDGSIHDLKFELMQIFNKLLKS